MKYLMAAILLLFVAACAAHADVLSDRSALNGILGGSAVTEDFESYPVADGDSDSTSSILILNSSAYFNGHGPGLVIDGVDFSAADGYFQWNGKDYYGQRSKDILITNTQTLQIDFWKPTAAFGFDLSVFSGYPDHASISVFGADKTTLLYSTGSLISVPDATPVFWGYSDQGGSGIGRVLLNGTSHPDWGVNTDNVEFAGTTAVPEPVSTALFLLGGATLAARRLRRK